MCKAAEVLLDRAARLGAARVDGEGRTFARRAALACFGCLHWVGVGGITSVFGCEGATACENVGQARAGWAGATSHDSDKAPDTLGPRKDAALAD